MSMVLEDASCHEFPDYMLKTYGLQGRIQDFKLGGAHLNFFRVFRVKIHDFTPKNHIFPNSGGRRENIWGISCEKSRFYGNKSCFPILGGGGGGGGRRVRPPGSAPGLIDAEYAPHLWIVV